MALLQYPSCIVFPRPASIPPPMSILIRAHGIFDVCVTQIYIRLGIHHRELSPLGRRRVL